MGIWWYSALFFSKIWLPLRSSWSSKEPMFPKRILNVDLYILLAQVFLLYQKISCRLKKRWYSAPLNTAHSLGNNEITTFFSQVVIKYIDRVHTYNFPRCNVCFGVNYMGFEEGWTASHKQCNSVNHWKLEKTRLKSSEHDIVFYMLCGGITAISPNVRESGKILPTEPGFLGFGIRNTTQEIRNPSIHR